MHEMEIFYNFVIGIASGIVSSVLVTIFYRIKDGEKERQEFFTHFRMYFWGLSNITSTDIDSLADYLSTHELPSVYKWIHLKKDEWILVTDLSIKVMNLNELICAYSEEKYRLAEQNKSEEDIDYILKTKYLHKIIHAKIEILAENTKIQLLGNKTLKKVLKNLDPR